MWEPFIFNLFIFLLFVVSKILCMCVTILSVDKIFRFFFVISCTWMKINAVQCSFLWIIVATSCSYHVIQFFASVFSLDILDIYLFCNFMRNFFHPAVGFVYVNRWVCLDDEIRKTKIEENNTKNLNKYLTKACKSLIVCG